MTVLLLHPKLGSGKAPGYISQLVGSGSCSEQSCLVGLAASGWCAWDISLGQKEALGC